MIKIYFQRQKLISLAAITSLVILSFTLLSYFPYGKGKNIKMVQTYWEEVWGKGNLQGVADFSHPNAKYGEKFSITGFRKDVASFREAFPDFNVTVKDIFVTCDKVISEVFTGTVPAGRCLNRKGNVSSPACG